MNARLAVGASLLAILLVLPARAAEPADSVMAAPLYVSTCDPVLNVAGPYYAPAAFYPGYFPGMYGWYGSWPAWWYGAYVPPPFPPSATLTVHFTNRTQQVMRTIDFGLIANGNLVAKVRDVGTFSPGIEIRHDLPLSPNVFPIQTALPDCVPLAIEFTDGTVWQYPGTPQTRRQVGEPTPEPSSGARNERS